MPKARETENLRTPSTPAPQFPDDSAATPLPDLKADRRFLDTMPWPGTDQRARTWPGLYACPAEPVGRTPTRPDTCPSRLPPGHPSGCAPYGEGKRWHEM